GQDAHARADREPAARAEGARPGLAVGEPEEAAGVDRADEVAELVGVGEQQDLAAPAAGAPDQGAGPGPLGRQPGLAPEALGLVEDRPFLPGGAGQLAEPLDQLEHASLLSCSEEALALADAAQALSGPGALTEGSASRPDET